MSLGWPGNASEGSPWKSWRKCLGLWPGCPDVISTSSTEVVFIEDLIGGADGMMGTNTVQSLMGPQADDTPWPSVGHARHSTYGQGTLLSVV
ncbi:hypothetical protein L3Q82_004543 [Scortum barcoo]|uniref:Uncharacterized protein n=1 Tax=Scortum barcoo TaxID=214431 RepID=A0ACB8VGL1_9TELE|nr:hypothetical protein L3Q82_004543 [Scortum barcoo]